MPIVQPGSIITMGSSNLVLTAQWAPVGVPYIILSGSSINNFEARDSSFTVDNFFDGFSIDGVYLGNNGYARIPDGLTGDLRIQNNHITITIGYDGKYIQVEMSGGDSVFSSDTYLVNTDPMPLSSLNGISIQLTATGAPAPADCTWAGGTSFIGRRADSILPTATFYGW